MGKKIDFVNHHVHSYFSSLDGMPSPKDIADRVVDLGQKSFSITDHGTLAGIPQAYRAAKERDLIFTPGCEMYFTKDRKLISKDRLGEKYYHMILLAQNDEGYHNLIKMQTPAWEEGYYHKPRIDYEILDKYHKGITVTTACLGSLINQLLLRDNFVEARKELSNLVDIFGKENVFVEIQRHGIHEQEKILGAQVKLAKEIGVPLLATCDSHYCCPEDHDYHDSLLCTATKSQKHETKRFKFETPNFYLHSGEEMLDLFHEIDFPGAVSNTLELAERTDFTMKIDDTKEYIMPKVHTKEGMSQAETLREHVYAGAASAERYGDNEGNIPDHVKERIDYELGVVNNMGFSGYFLIVENLVKLFAKNGIYVGPGRGCLSPETKIYTNDGLKPITEVVIGDSIITETGEIRKVNQVMVYDTEKGEKLISLTNEIGKSIRLTEKHKVLTSDVHGERKWKRAKDINVGDVVVYSSSNENKDYFTVNNKTYIKDQQYGYITGALLIADIINDKFVWDIKDNQIFAETLINILDNKNIKYTRKMSNGLIENIVLEDNDINNYFIQLISIKDTFIGLGSVEYTKGFVQSIRHCQNDIPCIHEFESDSDYVIESLKIAADSIGMQANIENNKVNIRRANAYGEEQKFLVTIKDTVDAPDKVYDISVDGEPSFLTEFGTVHNSAPGSVVVYCLGITNLDPFAHTLFFERFLNPDRISMPDIDIDVPQTKRHEALKLIEKEYGVGHVAHLSNYTVMAMRDSLQRMGKVFGLDPSTANKFCKEVAEYCESHSVKLEEMAQQVLPNEIRDKVTIDNSTANKIIKAASRLEGTLISYGVHASGIVVTDTPIDSNFPIRLSKNAPLPVCQYDGTDVEALGGVKLDMLGLVNLDQCEEAERNILLDLGEKVDTSSLPLDDPEVYKTLSEGRGGGIFQLGCLSGDTIIDGNTLEDLYKRRNSTTRVHEVRSLFFGEGEVKKNYVQEIVYSGEKELFELKTSNGESIKATANHKFFTQNGWVKLSDLDIENDKLITVNPNVGMNGSVGSVRGRKDIIDIISQFDNNLELIEKPFPITVNEQTFYPTFRVKDKKNKYLWVVGDHAYSNADNMAYKVNILSEEDDVYLEAISYSQVIEGIYSSNNGNYLKDIQLGLPIGAEWTEIEDIKSYGVEHTYDIMMERPVHNFIANNIVVHNSTGIKALSRSMQPDEFSDISALIALYRPGPMGMGTHDEYCRRKNDGAPMNVEHKDMEEILSDSYNLTVYQEDLMALAKHFAGYTGAEADDLRKAVAKKNPEKMEKQKQKFIPAVNANYSNNLGEKLWDIIEPFGAYAFCKAHSAAYAATTYRTAWIKTHYAPQFAGAVLDHVLNVPDKLVSTIAWIREENIGINPPDINNSELRTITSKDSITLPLDVIKGVGYNKAEEIIEERENNGKYKSVVDFVARNSASKRMLIAMAKAGTFDSLGANRAAIIANVDTVLSISKTQSSRNELSSGLFGSLFEDEDLGDEDLVDVVTEPYDVYLEEERFIVDSELYSKWERESIGILLGEHPYTSFKKLKISNKIMREYPPVDSFEKQKNSAKFSAVIMNISNKISKSSGKEYCNFNLETDTTSINAVCFTHIPEESEGSVVAIEGKIEDESQGNGDFIPNAVCYGMKKINVAKMREDELKNEV